MLSDAAASQFTLDWLVHPTTSTHFLDRYWERQPHLVGRQDPAYFVDLPSIDAVDELIVATAPTATRSRDDGHLVRTGPNGTTSHRAFPIGADGLPDIHSVYRSYSDGFSIVLNRIHRRSAAVALVCRRLERQLHHRVGANLYLTPRGAQGFRRHADDHDVLVLQLYGIKEWIIAAATGNGGSPPDASTFTLRQGDSLYIPRGFPHFAATTDASSLHLTIGIHTFSWGELLVEALQLAGDVHPPLTRALPLGFLDGPVDDRQVMDLTRQLSTALSDPAVLERARARLGQRLIASGGVPTTGHFRSIDSAAAVTTESVLRRAPGALCLVRTNSNEATIHFGDNHVSGPVRIEPALRFIARATVFVADDLPGDLSPTDKVDLVARLISEGLLTIVESTCDLGGADV